MNFRQKLVRRRNIAIRDTVIAALLTGLSAYWTVTQGPLWAIAAAWFGVITAVAAADIVRKANGIRYYDANPGIAYLVEIRDKFGMTGK